MIAELKALWAQLRIGWAITLLDWTMAMLPTDRRTYEAHQNLLAAVHSLIKMLEKETANG